MKKFLSVLLFLTTVLPLYAREPIQLADNGVTPYTIVLPQSPNPVQETAAAELASYLNKITGANFPIIKEDAPRGNKLLIIGPSKSSNALLAKTQVQRDRRLKYDQVIVQRSGSSIVFSGHPQRGMLYAVYTFLENDLGCRWWTSSEEFVPKNPSPKIQVTSVNYIPPLRYREPYWAGINGDQHTEFAVKMKCNGWNTLIPEEWGSHKFQPAGHSFYRLIPPTVYFKDFPEWFSEIDGVRKLNFTWEETVHNFLETLPEENRLGMTEGATQLCLTNERLLKEVVQNALAQHELTPEEGGISVSQNDNDKGGYCHCKECLAVNEEEGAPSGSLIRFVNAVAEEVEKTHPELYVETYAYEYTRKPPKKTRARKNVLIRLCSIECSYIQPLRTGEQNRSFAEDIEGWRKMADHLSIWDYDTNFSNYLLPFPNHRVLKDNINFYIENGAISIFEQGDSDTKGGNFVQLRLWLAAKLLWNPSLDTDELINQFLAGYYAPEIAPLYKEYLDRLADACETSGIHLGVYRTNANDWITLEVLNRATELHNRALEVAQQLVQESPEKYPNLLEKVLNERLSIDILWLLNGKEYRQQAEAEGKEYLGPDDPLQAAQDFFERFERYNGIMYRDTTWQKDFEQFKASMIDQFRP